MNSGRFILSQVLDLVHRQTLDRLVERYDAESRVRHFGCRQQLICMAFAQLTWREGLRDIAECLNARPATLYHLGFSEPVAKSTLADANEQRDWRLWEDLAKTLMRKARPLYAGEVVAAWDEADVGFFREKPNLGDLVIREPSDSVLDVIGRPDDLVVQLPRNGDPYIVVHGCWFNAQLVVGGDRKWGQSRMAPIFICETK